jgi:hypothetical protein
MGGVYKLKEHDEFTSREMSGKGNLRDIGLDRKVILKLILNWLVMCLRTSSIGSRNVLHT